MALELEDVQLMLDEVERFALERIAPASTQYEKGLDHGLLLRLGVELADLGLLPTNAQDDGSGLWAEPDDDGNVRLSLGCLQTLARASAGLALMCHRQALSGWLLRQCGCSVAQVSVSDVALVPVGHYGLARDSLGRWLGQSSEFCETDARLLADWLAWDRHDATLWSSPGWTHLLWPVWDGESIQWSLMPRHQLGITPRRAAHGLNELQTALVRRQTSEGRCITAQAENRARRQYQTLLKMEFLGLMAIGRGVLAQGSRLAHDFAAVRRQGGDIIRRHPAVQILLSEISSAEAMVEGVLASYGRGLDRVPLAAIASARLRTSDALVQASHQVVQVHGGVGYMRDVGPEKLVRDQNMLRLTAGGVQALPLLLAGLKEACA